MKKLTSPLHRYRSSGLTDPIRVHANWRTWALLLLAGPILLFGSYLALASGEPLVVAIGVLGVVFFGLGMSIMLLVMVLAMRRGVVEFSQQGLYLTHLDLQIPWSDIGPAWTEVVSHRGGATPMTCFIVRNGDEHRARAGWLGRRLMTMAKNVATSSPGSGWEQGLGVLLALSHGGPTARAEMERALEMARAAAQKEPGALLLNIPSWFGRQACEDCTALFNAELLRRQSDRNAATHCSATDAGGSAHKPQERTPSFHSKNWITG